MKISPVAEIKAQFSSYVKEAADGLVVVTKNGKPVAVILGVTDEDDIERLLLGYSPKVQAMLNKARERIRTTGGIPHDEFWRQLDAEYEGSTNHMPNTTKPNEKPTEKRHRKAVGKALTPKTV